MVQRFALAALTGGIAWLAATATVRAQTVCATPGTAATACSGNCAAIGVGNPSGPTGGTVQIPITFTQGPDDGHKGQGFDAVAAIAFTLGVPGTGTAAPLAFKCTNGDLADGSVTPGPSIASEFTVVVENAQCTNRTRCLCPDTTQGQTLDNFVNIVVYGPKNLPAQGPVTIPILGDQEGAPTLTLVTLSMQIASGASGAIPLHIFSTLDGASVTQPKFAANLSIGDEAACDVTATGQRSNVSFTDGTVTVASGMPCVGDCDNNKNVTVNELVTGVNIALGSLLPSACPAFEDQSGMVNVSQLIKGVNNALNGCP